MPETLPVVIAGYMSDKFCAGVKCSALASLMILPVMLFAAFTQRYLVRGLTLGRSKSKNSGTDRQLYLKC